MSIGTGREGWLIAAFLASLLVAWLVAGVRDRPLRLEPTRLLAFTLGMAAAAAPVLSPLDRLGADGLLTAHVSQHILLGDLAAPLLLLGLPATTRSWLLARLLALQASESPIAAAASRLLSPLGALAVWALATYAWFVPALHRAAVAPGPTHLLDHLSFLGFGLLIWLTPFDPRPPLAPLAGLLRGGLPWWGRHIYAMTTRLAMLLPPLVIWLASAGAYHPAGANLPLGYSLDGDKSRAAQLIVGFEMILFALAFVLAFIFLAIAEGHERHTKASR